MQKLILLRLAVILAALLVAGCSSTTLTGSWSSPENVRSVDKIYIVGVSKHETQRRIFEDKFGQQLQTYGIQTVSSYKDLPDARNVDQDVIMAKVRAAGADGLLMTRILGKRVEEVVNPGRMTGYNYGPSFYGPGGYYPRTYYHNYRDYYDHRYDMIYEPATISRFKVITLESNLYATATGELIWSAQLETVMGGSMESMVEDFIEVVIKDLVKQGVI